MELTGDYYEDLSKNNDAEQGSKQDLRFVVSS
jgi:hypothetical protein